MSNIAITEEFDNAFGQFRFLDSTVGDEKLQGRKHVDLRSFYSDLIEVPLAMYSLAFDMTEFDTFDMGDLEGVEVIRAAESWTNGTNGPDAAFGLRNTLDWDLVVGLNETESTAEAIDLSGFADTDTLVVSFANFPGTDLNLASCTLELEDEDANIVSLSFADADATDGPQGVSWPVSELDGISPTIVRFSFTATGIATVVVGNIRILASTWTATKLDMDTRTARLVSIFERDGTDPTENLPKLWRSDEPSGPGDPLPVDSRLAINFFTGAQAAPNRLSLFLRGRREDYITQLDLDGTDLGLEEVPAFGENQHTLDSRGHQPDYGAAVYNPRPQIDLEELNQESLDTYVQAHLERAEDLVSESWIKIDLLFGTVDDEIIIGTTETLNDEELFRFPIPVDTLADQTQYLFTCDLEANSVECSIFTLDPDGSVDQIPIFTTGLLTNDFLLKRRKGRIGWELDLGSQDVWVESIRSRGLSFGEIITNNFESFTPVEGARVFSGGSPDVRVPTLVVPFGEETTLEVDKYNARSSDGSFKVQAVGLSGVQTNRNLFEDFANTSISFDLFYPSANSLLLAGMQNERGYIIPLVLPTITRNQWQTITIRPTQAIKEQSGSYRFLLLQATTGQPWWIDNFNIIQRSVSWAGRASLNDAWGRENNRWTEFHGLVNSEVDGALFPERGFWTQMRGRALVQNAAIEKVYIKPKYSELGRLVWNES